MVHRFLMIFSGASCEQIQKGHSGQLADGVYYTNPNSPSATAVRSKVSTIQLCYDNHFFIKFNLKLTRQVKK